MQYFFSVKSVGATLDDLCEQFGLRYRLEKGVVIVEKKTSTGEEPMLRKPYWLKARCVLRQGGRQRCACRRGYLVSRRGQRPLAGKDPVSGSQQHGGQPGESSGVVRSEFWRRDETAHALAPVEQRRAARADGRKVRAGDDQRHAPGLRTLQRPDVGSAFDSQQPARAVGGESGGGWVATGVRTIDSCSL